MAFFVDSLVVYSLYFSTESTGGKSGCEYLILENWSWKLSHHVGTYLDEIFHDLRRKND